MPKPHLPETTLGLPNASNFVTAHTSTHAPDLPQWEEGDGGKCRDSPVRLLSP